MEQVPKALYNAAFSVWNTLIGIAMTIFTTGPKTAGGGTPYAVAHQIFTSISDATVPIATVFFLIALYKTVIMSPPGQQAERFLLDAVRYCMVLFLASKCWTIMGYVIDFADGITNQIGAVGSFELSMSGDLETIMHDCLQFPTFDITDIGGYITGCLQTIGCFLLFTIGGLTLVVIMVASCISILSSAFQRVLKPLIILPFSGIAVALGAGGHEISRSLHQYLRTFFGFCISGALMIICIKCGVSLTTNLVNFSLADAPDIGKTVLMTVQAAVTPIVIAGLVRGCDSIAARMF